MELGAPLRLYIAAHAKRRSAIVVGAGAAGLSCAQELFAAGVRVTLLEASARVGGRCHTLDIPGFGPIECGATWIHGMEGNPAFALCSSLGLVPHRGSEPKSRRRLASPVHLRSDGAPTDVKAVHEVQRILFEAVRECEEGHGSHASLGAHVRREWALARPGLLARHGDTALIDAAWHAAEALQCAIDGCGNLAEEDAGPAYANYSDFDGRNVASRPDLGGYSAAMEAMASPLREGQVLRLGRAVETVRWDTARSLSGLVEVVCDNGEVFAADAICVTVPLEPLHALAFEPPLPASTYEAMDCVALGQVEKILVAFEQEPNVDADAELPTMHLLWTDGVANESSSSWTRGLFKLTRHYDDTSLSRQILVGFLTGDSARAVSGRSSEELLPELVSGLSDFLSQLHGWRPVECYATSWCADPHFHGAYSYPRPGASVDVVQRLAAPLGDPLVLCFAGEATSANAMGTVGGAMQTGIREAERLLRAWGLRVS